MAELAKRPMRRTGADSADKRVPRHVTPRRDLVTFIDEPGQKRFTNRRKRTRLNKGGMFFNARDRRIVLLIAAHGWLDLQQLCALLDYGVQPNALRHSMKRLVTHGLVTNQFTGLRGQILYTASAFGLRKVGAKGFQTGVTPRMQTLEHTDAITAFHIHMVQKAVGNSIFLTERELNAAAASGELSPRVLQDAPWASGYSGFSNWIPIGWTVKGKPSSKRPDGYLLHEKGGVPQLPIAIEIERHVKSRPGYYRDALLAVANAAQKGYIAANVIYFAPKSTHTLRDLETALKDAKGLSLSWPAGLPRIATEVWDLDEFYTPFSAQRGWVSSR